MENKCFQCQKNNCSFSFFVFWATSAYVVLCPLGLYRHPSNNASRQQITLIQILFRHPSYLGRDEVTILSLTSTYLSFVILFSLKHFTFTITALNTWRWVTISWQEQYLQILLASILSSIHFMKIYSNILSHNWGEWILCWAFIYFEFFII